MTVTNEDDFEPLTPAQHAVISMHAPEVRGAEINSLLRENPTQIRRAHVRACIADAQREENSLSTRVDAAIQAIAFLDQTSFAETKIQRYLSLKYVRLIRPGELLWYHEYATSLAKRLLLRLEQSR
jgi:hypothetical protein